MRYGSLAAIRHSARKRRRAATGPGGSVRHSGRIMHIFVTVTRGTRGYSASACIKRPGYHAGVKSCGHAKGTGPTQATKRALAALAKHLGGR